MAISGDGGVLLSASPLPPTTLIQDRRLAGTAAVDFKSFDTSSAVTCAAFEILNGASEASFTQFVLGCKDGTLALYKMSLPSLDQSQTPLQNGQPLDRRLQPVKVGAMSKLHKAAMGGVTAAAFIPGYKSRVVSVGHDGRCSLVDFTSGGQKLRT